MKPGEDWESFQERIQGLLSFKAEGLKQDPDASNPITNPVGFVKRQLKAGFVNFNFKGVLGSLNVPGIWGYHSYLDLNEDGLKDYTVHIYGEFSPAPIMTLENASIVLHSHARDVYCPYKGGCHTLLDTDPTGIPVRYTKSQLPKRFVEMWSHVYNFADCTDVNLQ